MTSGDHHPRRIAGRYQLRSVLGHGSMGTVWSAYDDFLQRPVAVKEVRLPAGFPPGQANEVAERALREARAIASLSHPNVITLHDVVREDGEPFVVMEMLTAHSVAELIAEHGPLDTAQAAAVGDAVADALEAAHAAGITHRDVKPANVLVSADGRIKLTDFGISRNVTDATLTSTGLMLGSPAYMAPEVASGATASPAADLWGLGATLYTITAGEPPYDADGDPLATANAVVHDPVPAPPASLPQALATLIAALLDKDPDRRPAPAEVRRSLAGLRPPHGQPLLPPELFADDARIVGDTEQADDAQTVGEQAEPAAPARPAESDSAAGSAPLAADPGPLPFTPPAAPIVAGRGPATTALLVAAVVAAFVLASVGGFALARSLGGADVLPAASPARAGDAAGSGAYDLRTRNGNATMLQGDEDGKFRIDVPRGWSRFVTQQRSDDLPISTVVSFVSGDGRQSIDVHRFDDYFDDAGFDDYLRALRRSFHADDFVLVDQAPLAEATGQRITYRSVETNRDAAATGDGGVLGRTTYARLIRHDTSLWVIDVTVPTEQENRGRDELYARVAPTFERR